VYVVESAVYASDASMILRHATPPKDTADVPRKGSFAGWKESAHARHLQRYRVPHEIMVLSHCVCVPNDRVRGFISETGEYGGVTRHKKYDLYDLYDIWYSLLGLLEVSS
jgi:ABC-type Fe2+-enterobactin transport system substrate-binding protein